jgi:hypothetical protein
MTTSKYITWHWREHPIGFPLDPKDHDFKGPRTSPFVALTIEYQKDEVHLRQAIMVHGRKKELHKKTKKKMKRLLIKWLNDRLENSDAP